MELNPTLNEEEMQAAIDLAAEITRATSELHIAMYRTNNENFVGGCLSVASRIIVNRRPPGRRDFR